jgi:hypothetical protein
VTSEEQDRLYKFIEHGDDNHRAWLKEAIEAFFAGKPQPAVRGKNSSAQLLLERDSALIHIGGLIRAIAPFAAKHKQDKCFCEHCNTLRQVILLAAKFVETIQPMML